MNEQASAPVDSNQPDQPATPDLAQTLTARTEWVQRALSPWARRWLPAAAAGPNRPADRPRLVALTTSMTTSLLGHIQRAVEVAALWRVDTSTLQPLRLDRFGAAVVNRFPDTSRRFELQPTPAQTNPADLVLAGVGEAEAPAQAGSAYPRDFQPFGSLADFKAALEAKQREAAASDASPSPPPPPAPSAPPPPTPPKSLPPQLQRLRQTAQAPRQWSPGMRPRSKIEEVTPAAEPRPTPEPAEEILPPAGQPEADWGTGQAAEPSPVQRQPEPGVPPEDLSSVKLDVSPGLPGPPVEPSRPAQTMARPGPGERPGPPPQQAEALKPRPASRPAGETTKLPIQRSTEQVLPPVGKTPPAPPLDRGESPPQFPPLPEPEAKQAQQDQIEPESTQPDTAPAGETRPAPSLKPPPEPEQLLPSLPEPGQGMKPPAQRSVEPEPARPPVGPEQTRLETPLPGLSVEPTTPRPSEPELPPGEAPPVGPKQPEQAAPPLHPSPPQLGETLPPPVQRFEEPELTLREKPPVGLSPNLPPSPPEQIPPSPPPESGRRELSAQPAAKPSLSPEALPSIQSQQPVPPPSRGDWPQPATPSFPPAAESPLQRSTRLEPEQPPVGPGEAEPGLKPAGAPDQIPPADLTQAPKPAVQRTAEPELTLREFPAVEPEQPGPEVEPAPPLSASLPEQKAPSPGPTTGIVPPPTGPEPSSLPVSREQPPPPGQTLPPPPDLPQISEGEAAGVSTGQDQPPESHPKFGAAPLPPVQRFPEVEMPQREFPPLEPEPPQATEPPEQPPPLPGPEAVQRSAGVEMPLRKFPPGEQEPSQAIEPPEQPASLSGPEPVQRSLEVEMPLREFPPGEQEPSQAIEPPEQPPSLPGPEAVQRFLEVEMPLRKFPPLERVQPHPAEDRGDLPQPPALPPGAAPELPAQQPGPVEGEKLLPVEERPNLPASQAEPPGRAPAAPEAVVQRAPEVEEKPPLSPRLPAGRMPDRTPLTDEPGGLEREVIARATSSARMPLVEAGREANRVGQGKVVQTRPMAALPQARVQAGPVEVGAAEAWPGEPALPFTFRPQPATQPVEKTPLPLVPPIRIEIRPERTAPQPAASPPLSRVQRQPADGTAPVPRTQEPLAAPPAPAVVQREGKETASDSSGAKPAEPPDLDKLARQIYPLIKRMLAVERERRSIR